MNQLFNPENKFWSFVGKIVDAVLLGMLWLVVSLPVFSCGAATTAFYTFTLRQVENTEGTIWKSFFGAFRRYFKKATLLWIAELAALAFLGLDAWAAWWFYQQHGGMIALLPLILCAAVSLVVVSGCLYLYPLLARYDFPVKKLLRDAFVLALGNLPVTLTLLLMAGLVCLGVYYVSGLCFFWHALYVFFSSYFFLSIFLRLARRESEADKDIAQ